MAPPLNDDIICNNFGKHLLLQVQLTNHSSIDRNVVFTATSTYILQLIPDQPVPFLNIALLKKENICKCPDVLQPRDCIYLFVLHQPLLILAVKLEGAVICQSRIFAGLVKFRHSIPLVV
jgi:hypothetical protein